MKTKTFDIQRILIPLFVFVWWKRLHRQHPYAEECIVRRDHVVKVIGWRTALIDSFGGQRMTVTWCFKIGGKLYG